MWGNVGGGLRERILVAGEAPPFFFTPFPRARPPLVSGPAMRLALVSSRASVLGCERVGACRPARRVAVCSTWNMGGCWERGWGCPSLLIRLTFFPFPFPIHPTSSLIPSSLLSIHPPQLHCTHPPHPVHQSYTAHSPPIIHPTRGELWREGHSLHTMPTRAVLSPSARMPAERHLAGHPSPSQMSHSRVHSARGAIGDPLPNKSTSFLC